MELLDQQVHNVTRALVDHGMFDDTLVVFLSDNGGPCHASGTCPQKNQALCAGCNLPLQGYKHSLYEGGIRTAAFVAGAGLGVVPRRVMDDSEAFIHVVDWCRAHAPRAETLGRDG